MKKIHALVLGIMVISILAACQTANPTPAGSSSGTGNGQFPPSSDIQTQIASNPAMATQIASGGGSRAGMNGTPNSNFQTQIASNPDLQTRVASGGGPGGSFSGQPGASQSTNTPTAAPTSTPEPTSTSVSQTDAAVQVAKDYFAALQKGDFTAASKLVSAFSLMANKITAGDVVDTLTQEQSSGIAWSDLQVVSSQAFDSNTILVHVTYQQSSKDSKTGQTIQTTQDEQWPFRLELNEWRYNWSNIIDFKTLGVDYKLVNGLTVKPLQLTRYSDKIRLTVLAQNSTNEPIVIGGTTNLLLANFNFGSQTVQAENTRYILDSLRSYTNVNIDVKGLYTSYPDSVELIQSSSSSAAPWFTFTLTD